MEDEKKQQKRRVDSESASRSHSSREVLDSSSTSSLSVFADPGEGGLTRVNEILMSESHKSGECSPSRASMDDALKSEAAFIQFLTSIPDNHQDSSLPVTRNRSPAACPSGGPVQSKVGLDHLDNLCKLMEQLGELRDNNSRLQKRVQYLEDLKTLHDMHKEICEGVEYSSEDALSSSKQPYPLQKSATESHCPKEPVLSSSRSPSRYLSRRSRPPQLTGGGERRCRSKSVGHEDLCGDAKSRRLFPKWSRVKEAFGWESERKGSMKIKDDFGRRRSDESRQVYRHLAGPTWTRTSSSSVHSSAEDIHECHESGWKKASLQPGKYSEQLDVPQDGQRRQKSTPSPGSDNASSYREPTDLKLKSFTLDRETYCNQDFNKYDKDDVKRGKSPWGRVKTIIERHRDSLKRRSLRREPSATDLDSAIGRTATDSNLEFKDYQDFLENQPKLSTSSPAKLKGKKPNPIVIDPEDCVCPRTPSSSPTMQRKSRWNRVTKVLKGKKDGEKDSLSLSSPNTPNNQHDGNFTFDVIEEMSQISPGEMSRVGSDSRVHQMAPSSDIMVQLQRNLSEDFHRKIREWDRMREAGHAAAVAGRSKKPDEKGKPKNIKDLTWLEKELQKIEKEKQRLAKERLKYEERATRLEKLKETVLNANSSNKREVLVRTSAGEFRFEGISDAFTKKLYEWETKRGLGPELSTIALLDSSRQPSLAAMSGTLQRVLSRSESSIVDMGQPSHHSSNSLPSVKLPDSAADAVQPSRANSEPDLNVLAAFSNGTGISMVRRPAEMASPVASKDDFEDEFEEDKPGRKGSETYYGLLEENVILLEQLKEKEEICRRLQGDLGSLDEKMDDMNSRHAEETQRYREKLWEMHQQGATPRDVLCCRRTMEQLRKRIDALEKWTRKLRNDRDMVEINFQHHSKEQECMTLDLLEKMRELQAAGSSTTNAEMRESSLLDANTIERLQELSALLTKQTVDLEETLSEKSRQICHLKWELLHRDLSSVKMETEMHSHNTTANAHRRRSKYAHWRSRSSEEAPVTTTNTGTQKIDPSNFDLVATEVYGGQTALDELKATYLANTVQQLNKELMKLTSATSISTISKFLQDDSTYNVPTSKNVEVPRLSKKIQVPSKTSARKITVRRSSADNLSLVSTDDNRLKDESSTQSDDSSDEYYARVCYNSGLKSNNNDSERLLMSYGEHPPRTCNQRKKKFQKASKLNSSLGRKRSNTFHTNRDLQKPNISENAPQKCQSFRVARENYLEDSTVEKTSHSRRKIQNSHFNIRSQDIANYKMKMDHKYHEAASLRKSVGKVGVLETYNINWLREVASDSKLPILMQAQTSVALESSGDRHGGKCPIRSMSDKTKKENAAEKREHIQKKRSKKRLKSPDPSCTGDVLNSNVGNILPLDIPNDSELRRLNSSTQKSANQKSNYGETPSNKEIKDSETNTKTEIPTITIQLSKRKQRKSSCNVKETSTADEQTITIVMPKKRSLSSECESSISESSPREASMSLHSDQKSDSPDSTFCRNSTARSSTAPHLTANPENNENGNIRLMRLVSLNNFESPFENSAGNHGKKDGQHTNDQRAKKRRSGQENKDCGHFQTEENVDKTLKREKQFQNSLKQISNENSSGLEQDNSEHASVSHYVKSPSAPQLDWRKVCAKKVSKSGAPNVRTLIERYNQKLIESQEPKSPISSNLNSPATERKISTPVGKCCTVDYVPHFISTPNTPTLSPSFNLMFSSCGANFSPNLPQSPSPTTNLSHSSSPNTNSFRSAPSSPLSVARTVALRRTKEHFIASQSSTPTSPVMPRLGLTHSQSSDGRRVANREQSNNQISRKRMEDDQLSSSSMDSMNVVMMRAGENCRESRMPKRTMDAQRTEAPSIEKHNLKTSKSLSSSSLFKSVLSSDFKMPASLLRLKRSKKKKDMSTVTELCRQSLLLTTEDCENIPTTVTHKSCPNSPELKTKDIAKSSWIQRNIFRHK